MALSHTQTGTSTCVRLIKISSKARFNLLVRNTFCRIKVKHAKIVKLFLEASLKAGMIELGNWLTLDHLQDFTRMRGNENM